jgi:hypothetical protein
MSFIKKGGCAEDEVPPGSPLLAPCIIMRIHVTVEGL